MPGIEFDTGLQRRIERLDIAWNQSAAKTIVPMDVLRALVAMAECAAKIAPRDKVAPVYVAEDRFDVIDQ